MPTFSVIAVSWIQAIAAIASRLRVTIIWNQLYEKVE